MNEEQGGLISSHYLCPKREVVQVTNLIFTPEELEAMHNISFFTVKLSATGKIMKLFGVLESSLKEELVKQGFIGDVDVNTVSGKIFRGENYLNLPYIVLDYPKLFSKTSVFAYRSMFWWGKEFSFTLHLQGLALEKRRTALLQQIDKLRNQGFYICVNDNPWQYHFDPDNYMELDRFLDQGRGFELAKIPFLKLSRRLDLGKYEDVIHTSRETMKKLLEVIS